MSFIQRFKTAFNAASDWRFEGKKIQLAGKTVGVKNVVSIMSQLKMQTQSLTDKDINRWRKANQAAIDIENPKRYELYAIFDDAMHDLHLKGAIRNRKMAILGKPFRIVDAKGNTNDDLTLLLKSRWFKNFLSLAHDARFYGHSLIELINIVREPRLAFKTVSLVPRHHVCPEYGTLLKDPGDEAKKGIPYRDTPIMDTCIEVGGTHDLGELNSVAKEAISKKYILQFWDTFAELFGMPIRTATTSSRDPKVRQEIENMLETMGSAAWGLFPEGTTINLERDFRPDAYHVYDSRIDRANSEMSKAILGQTMTMDDGSSLSQAKVHENVSDELAEDDRDWIKDIVNDDLLPFLIKHGWPLKGYSFDWDNARVYTPDEMKAIEEMLLNYYDIDQEYFITKYGVKIMGTKQLQQVNEPKEEGTEKKKLMHLPSWVIDMPPVK